MHSDDGEPPYLQITATVESPEENYRRLPEPLRIGQAVFDHVATFDHFPTSQECAERLGGYEPVKDSDDG